MTENQEGQLGHIIPFAVRVSDQSMVEPQQVERGLACGCVCPACRERVIAKKGDIRTWHFAHHRDSSCTNGRESAIHEMAKQLIAERNALYVPPRILQETVPVNRGRHSWSTYSMTVEKGGLLLLEDVKLECTIEVSVDTRSFQYRPDIHASLKGLPIAIEIRRTHGVSVTKRDGLLTNGISVIEIDVGDVSTTEELKERLFSPGPYSEWLGHIGDKDARARLAELVGQSGKPEASVPTQQENFVPSHYTDIDGSSEQREDWIAAHGIAIKVWIDKHVVCFKKEGNTRNTQVLRALMEIERLYKCRFNRRTNQWEVVNRGKLLSTFHEICAEFRRRFDVDTTPVVDRNAIKRYQFSQQISLVPIQAEPRPDYPGREDVVLNMTNNRTLELFNERAAKYHYEGGLEWQEAEKKAQFDCQVDYALELFRNERR